MRCNTCGKRELVEIRMTVGGEELMFRRCGRCESQGWEGAGGSLTLVLQHESPGAAREANWLPVPEQPFQVVARLYWPKQELLDGTYRPPGISVVD